MTDREALIRTYIDR